MWRRIRPSDLRHALTMHIPHTSYTMHMPTDLQHAPPLAHGGQLCARLLPEPSLHREGAGARRAATDAGGGRGRRWDGERWPDVAARRLRFASERRRAVLQLALRTLHPEQQQQRTERHAQRVVARHGLCPARRG